MHQTKKTVRISKCGNFLKFALQLKQNINIVSVEPKDINTC